MSLWKVSDGLYSISIRQYLILCLTIGDISGVGFLIRLGLRYGFSVGTCGVKIGFIRNVVAVPVVEHGACIFFCQYVLYLCL